MKNLRKMRSDLYLETLTQRESAWKIKNYDKSIAVRKQEQINYEKWKLLDGIIKANDKEKKNGNK